MFERREIAARKLNIFHKTAIALVKCGITPNMVSVASAGFALMAGWFLNCLPGAKGSSFYIFGILSLVGIQFRLICNLVDGLMAVEGGMKSPTGDIFNDFPDRISDIFIFVGLGFALPFPWGGNLGWLIAILAVLTAYVRLLGASLGQGHDFSGPMAKQHRMAILTVSLICQIFERLWFSEDTIWSLIFGATVITLGSILTVILRLVKLSRLLKNPSLKS